MIGSETDLLTIKPRRQIAVDAVKPVTASESAKFGDDVIVSAVTRQRTGDHHHQKFVIRTDE